MKMDNKKSGVTPPPLRKMLIEEYDHPQPN